MTTQRTFTAEEAQKKMASLPPEVQELLYSAEMSAAVQKVGEKNKLHYDQMGRLEMETTNVLLGFTETADYPGILEKVLSVDTAAAIAIAKDMNDTLFVKIREGMKQSDQNVPKADLAEKSVVMPSAVKAPTPPATPAPAPSTTPTPTVSSTPLVAPVTIPAAPSSPVSKPTEAHVDAMQHVEALLSEPTVSMAPKSPAPTPAVPAVTTPTSTATPAPDVKKSDAPTPPPIYKTDPYHEPI